MMHAPLGLHPIGQKRFSTIGLPFPSLPLTTHGCMQEALRHCPRLSQCSNSSSGGRQVERQVRPATHEAALQPSPDFAAGAHVPPIAPVGAQ